MRQTLKRLSRMIAGYGAIQWAGPFLSFIFTPIITRLLLPSDYGIADYALTVSSVASTLALFALPQALLAHFNDESTPEWKRRLIGSAMVVACALGLALGAILFVVAPALFQSTFGTSEYAPLLRLIGATLFLGVLGPVLTSAAQAALRVRRGMVLSAVSILMTVAGNVLFIIVLRLGATGMVLTPVITGLTMSFVALALMRGDIGKPSTTLAGKLLYSGALLFPTMAATWVLQVADRFFLVQYVTTEQLGYYAIANRISSLLAVLFGPLYAAWTPLALSFQHEADVKQRFAIMSRYLVGSILFAALGLGLFAQEILIIFTRAPYLPASPYIGYLSYVHVFNAMTTILYIGALAAKELKIVSLTTMAGAVVNLVLNAVLIPPFGIWGATMATVIGYGTSTASLYVTIQRRFPVPYPTTRLLAATIVQFVLLSIGLFMPALAFPLRLAFKLLLLLSLPVTLIMLGVFTRLEIQQVSLALRHRLAYPRAKGTR